MCGGRKNRDQKSVRTDQGQIVAHGIAAQCDLLLAINIAAHVLASQKPPGPEARNGYTIHMCF